MKKLSKLDKRTLTICGIVFVVSYIFLHIISAFLPLFTAFFFAVGALIFQVLTCYQSQMTPCKKPQNFESEKHDPIHDWNNDYSVYRSATANNESAFKSMDEHNRSSSIANESLHASSNSELNR